MDEYHIKSWIERHEGRSPTTYIDDEGHPTVGVGFNLDRPDARATLEAMGIAYDAVRGGQKGLPEGQIDALLDQDVASAIAAARDNVSNFDQLTDDRQTAIVDMVFNLGAEGFAGFENTIDAIERGEWTTAAAEMQASEWFDQVGSRAQEDIALMSGDGDHGQPPNPGEVQMLEQYQSEEKAAQAAADQAGRDAPPTEQPTAEQVETGQTGGEPDAGAVNPGDGGARDGADPGAADHDAGDHEAPEHEAADHEGGGDHEGGDHDAGGHDGPDRE